MDHLPGPIIAAEAPRTAKMIDISECAEHAKNTHRPRIAIVIPVNGVQRPRNKNIPAIAAIRYGRLESKLAFSNRCDAPLWTRIVLVSVR